MAPPLSEAEIRKRLQRLRNYERLYPKLRREHEDLKRKYRALQAEFAAYKKTAEERMQAMEMRIEQLTQMVFGRKRGNADDHEDDGGGAAPPVKRRPRPSSSFRRAQPAPAEITSRTTFPIGHCPDCGHTLTRRETVIRFVEDIPLPKKTVIEQSIERGFCPHCRRRKSALPIPPQRCTLGPNVRLHVLFAITVLSQTFEKVKTHLRGVHDLSISDGEITAILHEGHRKLLPALQDIAARIRDAPVVHYDETGYPVQGGTQGNFAWIKTSAIGPETLFLLGRTRGKGNAEELRGVPSAQVSVTDDYGACDRLFSQQALCWAHPLRKFRDPARSSALSADHHERCRSFYERFHLLERAVAVTITSPLTSEERTEAAVTFGRRIGVLMRPDALDPPTLSTLKQTFLGHRGKYLLCIRIPGVPMTNNQAERRLRHLVIKRLLSFGGRTQKGAQVMETLLSVLLTLWWSRPKDYFGELRRLMAPA